MKIQINSLEALERLIGSDKNLEIEVKHSVVENFAKKHIKAIAQEFIKEGLDTKIRQLLLDEGYVKTELIDQGWGSKKSVLSLDVKGYELISGKITTLIQDESYKMAEKFVYDGKAVKHLNDVLERAAEHITETLTDASIEKRLEKMVDERLKSRLGLT